MTEGNACRQLPGSKALVRSVTIGAIGILILGLHVSQGLENGDAAVYAQQILERDFQSRPVHVGYFLIGALLTGFRPEVPDMAFNLVSVLFGGATLALIAWLAESWAGDRRAGLAAAAALLTNVVFLKAATNAEVYAPQAFFLVLSFVLLSSRRASLSGLAAAAAILITPSTLLALPGVAVLSRSRRQLTEFSLASMIPTVSVMLFFWPEYFTGDRGLFSGLDSPMNMALALAKEGGEALFGFFALTAFLVHGFWRLSANPSLRRYAIAIATMALTSFLFGERFTDVPVQLPAYVLLSATIPLALTRPRRSGSASRKPGWFLPAFGSLSALPVIALWATRDRFESFSSFETSSIGIMLLIVLTAFSGIWFLERRVLSLGYSRAMGVLLLACLAANIQFSRTVTQYRSGRIDEYRRLVLNTAEERSREFLAVGEWNRGILLEHYLYRDSYVGRWVNCDWLAGGWGEEWLEKGRGSLQQAAASGLDVWMLESCREAIPFLDPARYLCREHGAGTEMCTVADLSEDSASTGPGAAVP